MPLTANVEFTFHDAETAAAFVNGVLYVKDPFIHVLGLDTKNVGAECKYVVRIHDKAKFIRKRMGTPHEQGINEGREVCGICGYLEDAEWASIKEWHGDFDVDT